MDDKKKKGPRDRSKINLNEKWEVAYWTEKLDCSVTMLRKAVSEVGNAVKDVKVFMEQTRKY